MTGHPTASREEWASARAALLKREKELTRMSDELARERRGLPWVKVEKDYAFDTADGIRTLPELFAGRSQLVVYHFMFGPDYETGCLACSATADSFNGVIAHLNARDVTMACVSRAPLERLLAYRERMGWRFDWVSSHASAFNADFGVAAGGGEVTPDGERPGFEANELVVLRFLNDQPAARDSLPEVPRRNARSSGTDIDGYLSEGHGFSTFVRDGDAIYHCYSTYARGTEFLMGFYAILDRVPAGRDEGDGAMGWLCRHDEYGSGAADV
jgi:predicted dithiol-disulfide oxidoreductase (DUF899 family)